ncbi:hypothetical protein [Oleiagrimonas sp. MCCC 1A03011]|uniref:ATP-grasp domain-containing protein n=1 Tax=Oleiagrimonas sp. MCCC 1A03011 TaxID=1926883 RepID=UPI000DC601E0|nr:hypothetical protein [Oleiagrimonas sp. MCCC 1A03011]RAP59539.1 hypothetical protein BTJ49_02485 [Oleiagrimonas sp. MCCC 1A03011]
MDKAVLILAKWNEPHTAALRWSLDRMGIPTRIAPDFSRVGQRISIHADDGGTHWWSDACPETPRSIWFRRPEMPEPKQCMEADREFLTIQWKLFQRNLFDLGTKLLDTLWINDPAAAYAAESKLVQLQAAAELGIPFPDMVVTNHAEDVTRLIERWGQVIYKTFYPHSWVSRSEGTLYDLGVTLLDADSELPEASIAMCPGIFQRYIEKTEDIRVTVIGDRIFAVRVLKHAGGAYLDWRQKVLANETRVEMVQLPATWEDHIRRLMKKLGIVIGCADLVVDQQGDMYFLEINQAGQFLFVEEKLPEVPLLRAMTAMLIQGRCDYSLDACDPVHFRDYKQSAEHQRVMDSYGEVALIASEEP